MAKHKRSNPFIRGYIILIIFIGLLSGCIGQEPEEKNIKANSAIKEIEQMYEEEMPDDMAMLIINEPNKDEINKIKQMENVRLEENGQELLLVPAYNSSNLKVIQVAFEEGQLIEKEIVFEQTNTQDHFALVLEVFRPEGIPQYKIVIEYKGGSGEYLIAYDGKDGNSHFEHIREDTP
jgi:hypothetical protein